MSRQATPEAAKATTVLVETATDMKRHDALELVHAIQSDLHQLGSLFWDVGASLRKLRADRGFRALGYETFDACIEAELGLGLRQAEKMMAVVHWFARADASVIGLERSVALIAYSRAVGGEAEPGRLIRDNAPIAGIPVRQAATRHIQQAAREARLERQRTKGRSPAEREAARREKAVIAHVREVLGGVKLGRAQKVVVSGSSVVVHLSLAAIERHRRR